MKNIISLTSVIVNFAFSKTWYASFAAKETGKISACAILPSLKNDQELHNTENTCL